MQHFEGHGWRYELVDGLDGLYRDIEKEMHRWEAAGRHIPTQDQIDAATSMFGRYKGTACEAEAIREFLLPLGIGVLKIAEEVDLVYWLGDPRVKAILAVGLEELPELLASEDDEIRQLAKWRLEALT